MGTNIQTGDIFILPIKEMAEKKSFTSYLLHVIVELDLLLPEPGDELLGCDGPHLSLLGHDAKHRRKTIPQQYIFGI